MSRPLTIALHLGAHKTATSHLQHSLMAANEMLIENGIRFYGPASLRRVGRQIHAMFGLDPNLPPPRRSAADQLAFLAKDGHRLVFSEENFAGSLHDGSGRLLFPLYARAHERVAALIEKVAPVPVDLFVALRDPADFVTAAYSQSLFSGHILPAAEFLSRNPYQEVRWDDLLQRLSDLPGIGTITVWRYEDYASVFRKIVALMVGPEQSRLVRALDERVHASLSARAVDAALAWSDEGRPGNVAVKARGTFPVREGQPKFDPFSVADHARSNRLYEAQFAAIEAMAKVRVLRPA